MTENRKTNIPAMSKWRLKLFEVIFGYDTFAGKAFDVALIIAILLSVFAVMLESVEAFKNKFGSLLYYIEWFFTIIFTIEYIARIISIGKPWRYIFSFHGLVDFFAVIPTYLSIIFPPMSFLLNIRTIRLLRIFRILKLVRYLNAARILSDAIMASREKIAVFLGVVFTIVIIAGTFMYIVEGPEHGFTSIPKGIYWAIVTVTTVGYGDILPSTILGQVMATILMIMGYGIIAVPTGIVGVELSQVRKITVTTKTKACTNCSLERHDKDAVYCKSCGAHLL
ncbi:MAG: ion transporter [Bacteroidota bacterium]